MSGFPEAFEIVRESAEALTLRLDDHGLDGEAEELFGFVASEIDSGRHLTFQLEADRASVVTLEGIGALLRLLIKAQASGGDVQVVSPHPILERKLQQMGLLALLVER